MLRIERLVKVYPGPVTALQGVGLEVSGGMFGLLGPNGAGKSTLMRIVAGLLEPTSGRVTLDGIDVVRDPRQVWCRLGYLPQEFGFYPHLTGEAMLRHLLKLKGVRAEGGLGRLARELLARVNLGHAAGRKLRTYSGGMKQRLGIAQALAGDPRLIIVDEPTAGLDPEERLRFYHLLAEHAEGRIVLLSTHIVEDVAVLCPRFAVIHQGRLVAETTPDEARRALAGTMYAGAAAAGELDALARRYRLTQAPLVDGRYRARIHLARGAEAPPPGFEPVAPTLEDAYLVLMKENAALPAPGAAAAAATGTGAAAAAGSTP
jgi:ABC-type multidrug transport system ATPase subunit